MVGAGFMNLIQILHALDRNRAEKHGKAKASGKVLIAAIHPGSFFNSISPLDAPSTRQPRYQEMATCTGARGVIDTLPGSLPLSIVPDNLNPEEVAGSWIATLDSLSTDDFIGEALWKDLYALTGLPRTFYSAKVIEKAWNDVSTVHKPCGFTFIRGTAEVVRRMPNLSWVDARFMFQTRGRPSSICSGIVSLVSDDRGNTWKIWILRTILERLEGHPDVDVPNPQTQPIHANANQYDCLVVGAGQGGLSTAGRLQSLGINYLLIDKNDNIGDNWLLRYDSMKLHTLRAYAHLPFERTFPCDSYPELLSKYDLAKCYKLWCEKLGINVRLSSQLVSGSWDKEGKKWNLVIRGQDREMRVSARHLVLATGAGGHIPISPTFPEREKFGGLVLHSAEYKSASQWKGKSAVIIGSANTAHDICNDMVEAGLSSITMVQRGQTFVLPFQFYQQGKNMSHHFDAMYELLIEANKPQVRYNDTLSTNLADRIECSNPLSIANKMATCRFNAMMSQNNEQFDALERVGFRVKRCGNPLSTLYEEGGRHYIDVGTSAKVVQGLIKVKSGSLITSYTKNGLMFEDGCELEADIIVLATGYEMSLRPTVARILGTDVAAQIDEFWGLDEEGEVRGAWKPIGHPGLWYMGGPFGHSRFFSRFLSLQIKAELAGTPLVLYSSTPGNRASVEGKDHANGSHV
ncbi:hypothetical protein ACJ72_06720 [Emergomyces africanus]|uniref:FAD/NAD(P)-binding domain-containing protein n=1 Tax=Emergomyces africanus TaxID=1955775 RepID=A0A1B7NQL9_9EURO|nr:hypothetical protein ACJ72_06720 [Emergomyces africanus]